MADELSAFSADITRIVLELELELESLPESERLARLKLRLAPYPRVTQNAVLAVYSFGRNTRAERRDVREELMTERREAVVVRERRFGFLWGVAFILMLVVIALFVPNPTPFQYTIFRIVLALAAAGFTNYIEGMLNIKWKFVRATGPLAVFFVVFWFAPAALEFFSASTP
jgi:hypothetical protein